MQSLKAYPNPTQGIFSIHINGVTSPKGQLLIVDFSGRILIQKEITNTDTKINLSGLAAGKYILNYRDGDHYANLKIIKK
ncbi:T9SS type A sorting domain-containing protein [Arachidicoccus ginsenosidivorans]|uniref:T9SS type A sorting domain-containing protein n=1 Tax=Arachidicoccus ginsenosidivorans TaxID=496057 RepID=UPI001CEF85C3